MKISSLPILPKIRSKSAQPETETEISDKLCHTGVAAAAATVGAVVEGVGLAGIALRHTPAGLHKAYHDLYTSEHGPLYKGAWSLGIVAAAALAPPLAGVLGVGLGAYGGALVGYHHGFAPAMAECLGGLRQFDQLVGDSLIFEPRREP